MGCNMFKNSSKTRLSATPASTKIENQQNNSNNNFQNNNPLKENLHPNQSNIEQNSKSSSIVKGILRKDPSKQKELSQLVRQLSPTKLTNPKNTQGIVEPTQLSQIASYSLEQRMDTDYLSSLEPKKHFSFDPKMAANECILFETFMSLNKLNKFSEKHSQESFFNFCENEGKPYADLENNNFYKNFTLLKDEIQSDINNSNSSAILCYIKETFLYALLTSMFKEGNFYNLFNLRYFIELLNTQINQLQNDTVVKKVYRVSEIRKDELGLLDDSVKKTFLLRGFISTSSNYSLVESFLENKEQEESKCKLLITINVDEDHRHLIHAIKYFSGEDEYLINNATFVTIDKISREKAQIISIECSLQDFDEYKSSSNIVTREYRDKIQQITETTSNLLHENFILFEIFNLFGKYEECILVLHDIPENEGDCLILKYHYLGYSYEKKAEYANALKYHENSLNLKIKTYGNKHHDTGKSYHHIAGVYYKKSDFTQALKYYNQALEIRLACFGETNPETATTYNNIGMVHEKLCQYDEALKYYNKSLKIKESTLGRTHQDIAMGYNNLGSVYAKKAERGDKSDKESASKNFDLSMKMTLLTVGNNHLNTAIIYNNLGSFHLKENHTQKTLDYYTKAYKIRLALLGENHPDTAECYNFLGFLNEKQGNNETAFKYYNDCMNIQLNLLGENHLDMATTFHNIGSIYAKNYDWDNALVYFEKSLKIRREILGENNLDTVVSYRNIGGVRAKKGEFDIALKNYEKVLEIRLKCFGENHLETAASHNNIGWVYYKKRNFVKAFEHLGKALKIREGILDPDHKDIVELKAALENLRK